MQPFDKGTIHNNITQIANELGVTKEDTGENLNPIYIHSTKNKYLPNTNDLLEAPQAVKPFVSFSHCEQTH